jgi:uncharacterized membrane protein
MVAISLCLLLGPFVAMGLYDLSRRRGQGLTPAFMDSLTCWKQHLPSMGMLVGVMLLWASLVALLVGFSVALPMAVGLSVVGPLLGHASWHAYRDSVRWL